MTSVSLMKMVNKCLSAKDTGIPRGKSINRIWVGRQGLSREGPLSRDGHTLGENAQLLPNNPTTLGLFFSSNDHLREKLASKRMLPPRKLENTFFGLVGRTTTLIIRRIWGVYKV